MKYFIFVTILIVKKLIKLVILAFSIIKL